MHRILAIMGFVLLSSGCTTWTKKGDVLVSDGKPHWSFIASQPAYDVRFPSVKIGMPASTTIRVRGLPAPIFPEYATIEVPIPEDYTWRKGQPWRAAVFQFTFRTTDGAVLHSQKVALEDCEIHSEPGDTSSTRKINFLISPWSRSKWAGLPRAPSVTSYDLTIDVLVPSLRPNDALGIRAFLLVSEIPAVFGNNEGE